MSERPFSSGLPLEGLSSAEAAERMERFGRNELIRRSRWARLRGILATLSDPMALMLAAAAAVYLALGDRENGIILLVALVPVLAIDVILESRSRAALRRLAAAVSPRSAVVRDGVVREIPTEELVPGDIVVLREGDFLHADGTVRIAANLTLDESSLTGEADPQEKAVGDSFHAGTTVLSGQGFGEVETTGGATRLGQIGQLMEDAPLEHSLLQRNIHRVVRMLAVGALIAAAGLFVLGLMRGETPGAAVLPAISLAISAAPEEFLLVFTVFLTLGAWKLSRHGVLVRRLPGVESLGSTTVICTDKTGTITLGHFTLEEHVPLAEGINEDDLLLAAALACEPHPVDPLEQDVLAHCAEHGIDLEQLDSEWTLVHDYAFDPIGKHMAHGWERTTATGIEKRLLAKGALEGILEHCAITDEGKTAAYEANARLADGGYRVLAVASREGELSGDRGEDERELNLLGLIGFHDPVRPEVPEAIRVCQSAGIDVKLVTGDHVLTAHAIATAAGIEHDDEWITSGQQLDEIAPAELDDRIARSSILARIRPEQKYRIVDSLVRRGEVVAMTGDGINDAPALRRASIGVSMGIRGTHVAREAADLVLLEDDFTAIVTTIREGRRIFENIQRAFLFLIPVKIAIVALAFLVPLFGFPPLLLPIHLVWLELIIHPVAALVFESQAAAPDVMSRPPRDPAAPLLSLSQLIPSVLSALLLAAAGIGTYLYHFRDGVNHARAMSLVVILVGLLVLIWAARAGDRPWSEPGWPAPMFHLIWIAVALTIPLIIQVPGIARTFSVAPLHTREWLIAIPLGILPSIWRVFGTRRREVITSS